MDRTDDHSSPNVVALISKCQEQIRIVEDMVADNLTSYAQQYLQQLRETCSQNKALVHQITENFEGSNGTTKVPNDAVNTLIERRDVIDDAIKSLKSEKVLPKEYPTQPQTAVQHLVRRSVTHNTGACDGSQDGDEGVPSSLFSKDSTNELQKLLPNTLYLSFNVPEVDDCHRGLFLTPPHTIAPPKPATPLITTGTLFHAVFDRVSKIWTLEVRAVSNLAQTKSLVLMYAIHALAPQTTADRIEATLSTVEFESRGRAGNPKLDGYNCTLWIEDALLALCREGILDMGECSVEEVMRDARVLAGPEDPKEMIGKAVELRVFNQTSRRCSLARETDHRRK